jgi:hypothetical protein
MLSKLRSSYYPRYDAKRNRFALAALTALRGLAPPALSSIARTFPLASPLQSPHTSTRYRSLARSDSLFPNHTMPSGPINPIKFLLDKHCDIPL